MGIRLKLWSRRDRYAKMSDLIASWRQLETEIIGDLREDLAMLSNAEKPIGLQSEATIQSMGGLLNT